MPYNSFHAPRQALPGTPSYLARAVREGGSPMAKAGQKNSVVAIIFGNLVPNFREPIANGKHPKKKKKNTKENIYETYEHTSPNLN